METIKDIKVTYGLYSRFQSIAVEYTFAHRFNTKRHPPEQKIIVYTITVKELDAEYKETRDMRMVYDKHIQQFHLFYDAEIKKYKGWEDVHLINSLVMVVEKFINRSILHSYDKSRVKFPKRKPLPFIDTIKTKRAITGDCAYIVAYDCLQLNDTVDISLAWLGTECDIQILFLMVNDVNAVCEIIIKDFTELNGNRIDHLHTLTIAEDVDNMIAKISVFINEYVTMLYSSSGKLKRLPV